MALRAVKENKGFRHKREPISQSNFPVKSTRVVERHSYRRWFSEALDSLDFMTKTTIKRSPYRVKRGSIWFKMIASPAVSIWGTSWFHIWLMKIEDKRFVARSLRMFFFILPSLIIVASCVQIGSDSNPLPSVAGRSLVDSFDFVKWVA